MKFAKTNISPISIKGRSISTAGQARLRRPITRHLEPHCKPPIDPQYIAPERSYRRPWQIEKKPTTTSVVYL